MRVGYELAPLLTLVCMLQYDWAIGMCCNALAIGTNFSVGQYLSKKRV